MSSSLTHPPHNTLILFIFMNEVEAILKYRILIPEVPVKTDEVAVATQDFFFKKSALNNEHGSCYGHQNPSAAWGPLVRKLRLLPGPRFTLQPLALALGTAFLSVKEDHVAMKSCRNFRDPPKSKRNHSPVPLTSIHVVGEGFSAPFQDPGRRRDRLEFSTSLYVRFSQKEEAVLLARELG